MVGCPTNSASRHFVVNPLEQLGAGGRGRATRVGRVLRGGYDPQRSGDFAETGRGHRSGGLCSDALERIDLRHVDLRGDLDRHVAVLALPFVALLEEHGAEEADDRLLVGEDAHPIGAPLHLLLYPGLLGRLRILTSPPP